MVTAAILDAWFVVMTVLTLGNFDGVHLGHRAIIAAARRLADARGAVVRVVTFDPFPAAVLRGEGGPPRLLPTAERVTRLREAGADEVVVVEPSRELLGTEPEPFIERLVREHGAVAMVEGDNFRFGRERRGDVAMLRRLGAELGFAVEIVPPRRLSLTSPAEARVSSTLIRNLVGHGRVFDAGRALGRGFSLTAPVARGEQRGRTLGIPTANLDAEALARFIVPADGVYAGVAEVLPPGQEVTHQTGEPRDTGQSTGTAADAPTRYPAAISVGIKPTFGVRTLTVEAHLLGYTPEPGEALYGRVLRLSFARWLRDQYAFPGPGPLREQLQRDVGETRRLHDAGWLDTVPGSAGGWSAAG
mgnify:FL=1